MAASGAAGLAAKGLAPKIEAPASAAVVAPGAAGAPNGLAPEGKDALNGLVVAGVA